MPFFLKKLRQREGSPSRIPRDLCAYAHVGLFALFVNRRFPTFILNPALHLKIVVNTLDGRNLEDILGGASRYEVFGRLCVSVGQLYLFSGREMIREPRLAAFGFTANPISHNEAFIGVTLLLNLFP